MEAPPDRSRHLAWEGCFNVRDLGGLPAGGGLEIRRGAVVRADSPDGLTAAGWAALEAHGVRTIVDLRNDDERGAPASPRPAGIEVLHLPLDALDETEFWNDWMRGPQFATPLYYRPHLERFPGRSAQVIAAIAHARPGGVLVHCVGGRDRTGQIAMLALALAGVAPSDVAADHALSRERLRARYAALGEADQGVELEDFLAARGTSAEELIVGLLETFDVEEGLRAGGLGDADLAALRARLLVPSRTSILG